MLQGYIGTGIIILKLLSTNKQQILYVQKKKSIYSFLNLFLTCFVKKQNSNVIIFVLRG